jgi:nucleoside-diphosphate-sugar epimerase
MECLVTGAAGFIGSYLAERLIKDGHRVIGVDSFTPYYPRDVKERNLQRLRGQRWFELHELDLAEDDYTSLLTGIEWVFHLAAMPGLVKSWTHFDEYNRCNITATQRLLEVVKELPSLNRFIYASTSSVYGRFASGDETLPLRPSSPYGVTKLAGENLCRVYCDEFDVPAVCLRYFSVYGPRQRPDMGYHKFIRAVLSEQPIHLTGDGLQIRGNTFVSDCVEATLAAVNTTPGEVFNVGGGELVTMWDVIRKIETIAKKKANVVRQPERKGDQRYTGADASKLYRHVGWRPKVGIDDGLAQQVAWLSELEADRRLPQVA